MQLLKTQAGFFWPALHLDHHHRSHRVANKYRVTNVRNLRSIFCRFNHTAAFA
ncbi:hypothetical protein D3C71_2183220 [compost metagenome]